MFQIVKPHPDRPFTIGRSSTADLCFPENFVSREHAILRRQEGEWILESLTSNSITLLNGLPIEKGTLADGDIIVIGIQQIRVELNGGELSLLLYKNSEAVETKLLSPEWKSIEMDSAESKGTSFRARTIQGAAELQFSRSVVDEKGRRRRKVTLVPGESVRFGQTEMAYKDACLMMRHAAIGFDVQIRNLDVYAGRQKLLSGIDFDLPAGEILVIIGRSGQGKSSLLKFLEGLYRPGEEGSATIGGVNYRHREIRERIAILDQEPALRQELTVEETLLHGGRITMQADDFKKQASQRVNDFCELFGLNACRHRKIATLSGGELRRTALAQELMANPGLIILDEPLSGLDPYNSKILCSHLKKLAFLGHTIILTTHSYEALQIANKVFVLHQGGQGFYGNLHDAYRYFQTSDSETLLSQLDDQTTVRWKEVKKSEYDSSITPYRHVYFFRHQKSQNFFHEIGLTLRQWGRDRGKIAALLSQPIIIGFLFSQIFSKNSSLWIVAFAIILCANWFALSISIREIVQEKNILRHEFRKGKGIFATLSSKMVFPTLVSWIQTAIVYAFIAYRIPVHPSLLSLSSILALTLLPAVSMGLFVSTFSKNPGQANAFLPLTIIPQVALSGALVPLDQMLPVARALSAVVWSRYNQESLLNLFLERTDTITNCIGALSLAALFFIITLVILHQSRKAR